MKNKTPFLKRMRESRLFWPLVALALILIVDAIFAPVSLRSASWMVIFTGISSML